MKRQSKFYHVYWLFACCCMIAIGMVQSNVLTANASQNYSSDGVSVRHTTFYGLAKNEKYSFAVVKNKKASDLFANSNVYHIDQGTSDSNGKLSFEYTPKPFSTGYECIFGVSADSAKSLTWTVSNSKKLAIWGTAVSDNYIDSENIPWSSYKSTITSVVILDGVTDIPAKSFSGMKNLTSIELPGTIRNIKSSAFQNCTSLKNINIDSNVNYIHPNAFTGCSNLVIHGKTGSYAEQYALQNGISFVSDTPSLSNTSKISSSNITLGDTVTIKASATGGSGNYSFAVLYKQTQQSSWTTKQNFSSNSTVSIQPKNPTKYDICVKVQDGDGTIEKKYFTINVQPPALQNTSKISSSDITLGDTVTIKASATGGSGDYRFAVLYKQTQQSSWTTKQNFSYNNTISIQPKNATEYDICVKVQDSDGTIEKKYFTVNVQPPALQNTSKISSSNITLGNTVTVKASATGGSGYYNFAVFYKQKKQSSWTVKQDFISNTTILIQPQNPTEYDICVKVKDSEGTIEKKYFTVNVLSSAALQNTSKISSSDITLGDTVTIKASATGGSGDYRFAALYKQTQQSSWTTKQNFSYNNTISIQPKNATEYDICVKAQDSDGTIEKKYFTVNVQPPALQNTSKISSSNITLGNTVTVKASATGGSGYYNFAVFYKQKKQSSWTVKQDFISNTTILIQPQNPTEYDICVKVKDSEGTVEKKYFTVTVQSSTALQNTSTISSSAITLGDTVTIKASATGGSGDYRFAALYKQTQQSSWTTKQNFSYNNTISIQPKNATEYDICVKVQDSDGTIEKKYFTIHVQDQEKTNSSEISEVIRLTNEERQKNNLIPFMENENLSAAAQKRAEEIAESFSGTRPNGTICFTVLSEYGISYKAASEHIISNYTTPESLMNNWIASEGYMESILNSNYSYTGVGVYKKNNTKYWVQIFVQLL